MVRTLRDTPAAGVTRPVIGACRERRLSGRQRHEAALPHWVYRGEQPRSIGLAAVCSMLAGLIGWQIALLASRAGKTATAH